MLERLPSHLQHRIVRKLASLSTDPFAALEHYEGRGFKLRVGDYRCIIDVDTQEKTLTVRVVGHRSIVYKIDRTG
jgi:mRNA-degrading endonuclease RelE of RelBE toxin-antitoxin system